jgi:hypothetical protein
VRNSASRLLVRQPNKNKKVDVYYCCTPAFHLLKLKMNSDIKMMLRHVSQHNANAMLCAVVKVKQFCFQAFYF